MKAVRELGSERRSLRWWAVMSIQHRLISVNPSFRDEQLNMGIPREDQETKKKNRMKGKNIIPEEAAYIAGFVDGDGSINAQIMRRPDYTLKFQIRVSITFFQKVERYWFLLFLKKKLGIGSCRKRNDGMGEYIIVGKQSVLQILDILRPYLRIKKRQAILITSICCQLKKEQDPLQFLKVCEMVDLIETLNDSKEQVITSETVRAELNL